MKPAALESLVALHTRSPCGKPARRPSRIPMPRGPAQEEKSHGTDSGTSEQQQEPQPTYSTTGEGLTIVRTALICVAQWVSTTHQEVAGSVPRQDTGLGCRLDPPVRESVGGSQPVFRSHIDVSLSPSPLLSL